MTPDGSRAYVTDTDHDQVVVLAASTLRPVTVIAVGATPWDVAFTAEGSSAYATNANEDTVSVIDTARRRVTATIALGESASGQLNHIPTAIALGPGGSIWLTCDASSSLVAIDPSSNTVSESIDIGLGDEPTAIAFA